MSLWQELRQTVDGSQRSAVRGWWSVIIYIICMGLALYTHYTTVFLIGVHGLFWAWLLWQRGQKRLILAGLSVAVLVALPLIPFTIPRLFAGKEANFFYVSPWVMLQDVVRFFSLGLTVDFKEWWARLFNLLTVVLLVLGVVNAGKNTQSPRWLKPAFLLSYLLAVVGGLAIGSLIKPMYQGVRHIMIGSPAFVLLIVYGWWGLIDHRPPTADRWLSYLAHYLLPVTRYLLPVFPPNRPYPLPLQFLY